MPSFLSKVFGRSKKEEKDTRQRPSSDASLLEGKFEAVPPVLTPTTPSFNGNAPSKDLSKQRSAVDGKDLGWHLSLNLPSPKEQTSKALGAVFEADPDAQILLSDAAIAERRLNPLEAFLLVQACSQSITAHGLETLGIMIPHYYSASPATQRKLISMFIHSLALNSPITTLSPSASSPVSDFESEVNSTRSPHDVAAVLRWGVRHLQLDNSCFGKDELWYKTFHDAEKASEYPPKAFTEKLVPLLPPSHLHLLTALLDIFSSLAAHAEANGISGSKLTRMLGYWMVSAPRVIDGDDYPSFYARWDKWGRIVEHLFLSRIRDETVDHRMPTRLTELVKQYPYAKSPSPTADSAFLPTPRFSTRKLEALYVRIDTEILSTGVKKPKNHALRLIADALKSTSSVDGVEAAFWESLRKHVSVADAESESYPGLSSLFADETIRFLSLLPMASDNDTKPAAPPPFSLVIPANKVARRRSMSMGDKDKAAAAAAVAHAKAASASSTTASSSGVPASESTEPIAIDWAQFSTSGFFSDENGQRTSKIAQTLLDNKDVEITLPRVPSSVRRKLPPPLIPLPSSRGRSLDIPAPKDAEEVSKQGASKATRLEIVQIDEAFADFWADALLDPISADWPSFVLCKVKSSIPAEFNGKRVQWLIIEQRFVAPPPPPQSPTATLEKELRPRPNSPKPSFASDSKSTKKKRFSFFTSLSSSSISSSSTSKKKSGKNAKVGEMGEILQEEEEEPSPSSPTKPSAPSASAVKVEVIPPATDDPQPVVDAAAIQIQPSVAAPPVAERPPTNVDIDADAPGVPEVTEKAAAVEEHISEPTNAPPLVPEVPEVGIVSPQPIAEPEPSVADNAQAEATIANGDASVVPEASILDEHTSHPSLDAQLEEERAKQAQVTHELQAAAERERLEKLEQDRQQEAEAARIRAVEAAAENDRRQQEEARQQQLADDAREEEARRQRLVDEERLARELERIESDRLAKIAEESRIETERVEAELAAAQERAEQARVTREREKLEQDRRQQEEARQQQLADDAREEEARRQRLVDEERVARELERIESDRLAKIAEESRIETERVEAELAAAQERAEQARVTREREKLEQDRRQQEEARQQQLADDAREEEARRQRLVDEERVARELERIESDRLAKIAEESRIETERVEAELAAAQAQHETGTEGHIEPLHEVPSDNDVLVDLPPVPVVEMRPDLVRGDTIISHLELTPPLEANPTPSVSMPAMLPGGETPGPQVALDIDPIPNVTAADIEQVQEGAVEPSEPSPLSESVLPGKTASQDTSNDDASPEAATEGKPAEVDAGASEHGNGANGHDLETEKPSE